MSMNLLHCFGPDCATVCNFWPFLDQFWIFPKNAQKMRKNALKPTLKARKKHLMHLDMALRAKRRLRRNISRRTENVPQKDAKCFEAVTNIRGHI